jgi:predicted  nucleic acid-binding Zn-ribbon protein
MTRQEQIATARMRVEQAQQRVEELREQRDWHEREARRGEQRLQELKQDYIDNINQIEYIILEERRRIDELQRTVALYNNELYADRGNPFIPPRTNYRRL